MTTLSTTETSGRSFNLDTLSFIILQVTLFFAPLFFIPSASVPFQIGKSSFILFGILLTLICYMVARLKDGTFELPRTILYWAAGILAVVYALAAILSPNRTISLAGNSFEVGTLSFFLSALLLFALVPVVARTQEKILSVYKTLLWSLLVVGLFHVIRVFFGPTALSFGIFTGATSNLFGTWNDLGIFFGLGTLVAVITLERAKLSRTASILVHVGLVLSFIMLVVVNFSPVWITLALLALVVFVYEISFGKLKREENGITRLPYYALALLLLSVVLTFAGGTIGSALSERLGTSQIEVRPSWSATYEISKAAVKDNPVLGAGPNRFSSEWLLHKPAGINNTVFWNTDFNYGIGFIPSFLATTGILGFLAIIAFAALFLYTAVKALIHQGSAPLSRFLVLISLFGSIYLWIFSFIYVPSVALWVLTITLSGLLLASLREDKVIGNISYSVVNKPAASFISVLITILALIAVLSFGYFVTIKLISASNFGKAVIAGQAGNLDQAETYIGKAIALSPRDVYYQSLAELYLARLSNLFNDEKISQADAQKQFQQLISVAIQAGQQAVALDTTNYQNHLELGRVFEAVVPLNIEGAYDSAKKSYEAALAVNPENPQIYFILARLEVANKNDKAAEEYINQALTKKSDYADAIFLLSQIQIARNDVPNAIKSVSAVATLSPSDPGIFFQLGLLYYNQKDYESSTLALERAVSLNAQYANAKYFLGLSYYQTGSKDKALTQFEELLVTNPDNADVKAAVEALKAGKSPLTAPVKGSTLPVKESTTKEQI